MELLTSTNKEDNRGKVLINAINTQYNIIKKVATSMGYRLTYNDQDDADLFWYDLGIDMETLAKIKPYQKINHFPGMNGITKKNNLAKNLNKMRKVFPAEYKFFPRTWILPSDFPILKEKLLKDKSKYYIVKPDCLSQGQGIFITRTFETVGECDHFVVQKYLCNPYLIDGLKFDLRIYILVYGCDPLRIYMFREGLARFCTEKYTAPATNNITNMFMHLTNYAINKTSSKYIYNKDSSNASTGHKRSLTSIWNYIDEHNGNSHRLIQDIQEEIVKTIISIQPCVSHLYHSCQPGDKKNDMCFEILGFDVMIDSNLKPYILEVNQAPSFNTDSPFDEYVKSSLLTETFKLINLKPHEKQLKPVLPDDKQLKKGISINHTQRKSEVQRIMKIRDEYEITVLQYYSRIFPNEVP